MAKKANRSKTVPAHLSDVPRTHRLYVLKRIHAARGYAAFNVVHGTDQNLRGRATFGVCEAGLDVTLALAVRVDLDAGGAKLVEYAEAIGGLIQGWNLVEAGDELTDLAVPGVFEPGGVQVTGGSGPDFENDAWTVVQNFTLRGTVPHGNDE